MSNEFFGPPGTPNPTTAAIQNAYAPPAQAAREALAGLDSAAIETRYPYFAPDVTFEGTVNAIRLVNGKQIGVAFFVEIEVTSCSDGATGMHAVKIDGFNNLKARNFAMSDLKNLMLIALGARNPRLAAAAQDNPAIRPLAADWAGDWIDLAVRMCEQNLAVGTPIRGQTSLTAPSQANGKRKLKCIFSAAG